ncbi:hypothetical protein MTO96_023580 [Rhipicephalus appendiculatus]
MNAARALTTVARRAPQLTTTGGSPGQEVQDAGPNQGAAEAVQQGRWCASLPEGGVQWTKSSISSLLD